MTVVAAQLCSNEAAPLLETVVAAQLAQREGPITTAAQDPGAERSSLRAQIDPRATVSGRGRPPPYNRAVWPVMRSIAKLASGRGGGGVGVAQESSGLSIGSSGTAVSVIKDEEDHRTTRHTHAHLDVRTHAVVWVCLCVSLCLSVRF